MSFSLTVSEGRLYCSVGDTNVDCVLRPFSLAE